MGLNDIITLITSPPFFISVFGPTLININYWILRGKLSRLIIRQSKKGENDDQPLSYRELLLRFLNQNDFETVFAHSIQLMVLFAATVFFAVEIFVLCWSKNDLQPRLEHLWQTDIFFCILTILIICYYFGLILTLFNGELATEKIISSYEITERKKRVIPPLNTVTLFRFLLFLLVILFNYWKHHHA